MCHLFFFKKINTYSLHPSLLNTTVNILLILFMGDDTVDGDDEQIGPMFDEITYLTDDDNNNNNNANVSPRTMTYRIGITSNTNRNCNAISLQNSQKQEYSNVDWSKNPANYYERRKRGGEQEHRDGDEESIYQYIGGYGKVQRHRKGHTSKKMQMMAKIDELNERITHLEERREWVPGTLARAMLLSLGYGIGEDVCDSSNGLYVAIALFLLGVANEFVHSFVKGACKTVASRKKPYGIMEKVFILIRHFAATAIAYAAGEILLRRTFGGNGNIPTVIIMLIIVFSVADLSDLFSVVSSPPKPKKAMPRTSLWNSSTCTTVT